MKTDLSLQQLAAELTRQTESRKDYIAPQGKIEAAPVDGDIVLNGINGGLGITPYAHAQLADHLDIPKKYYDRMKTETPDLLAVNVNRWLSRDPENKRMIRTLDGKVRAVLSPKFRPLDNFDLANAVLPTLLQQNAQIVSSSLTETRMYIKAILPGLSDELPDGLSYGGHNRIGTDRGHLVAAIVISNSDIGAGTLRVEPSVFTTFCTNLAIRAQAAMKKYHTGRTWEADAAYEVFTDATRKADDSAFWMKVQDITKAAFDEKSFRAAVAEMRQAGQKALTSDNLQAVIEATVEEFKLPVSTVNPLLKTLAAGGDFTAWGLSSAITRVAGDVDDYELATSMERAGGLVIDLPATNWKRIAEAA